MKSLLSIKEAAAETPRRWVRLTKVCNNRCLFCLDKDMQDGTCRSPEEVVGDMRAGREQGATRLTLSGGEPTVHPKFAEFVRLARGLGYSRIQVVTNGRMFAYPKFVARCKEAGLDETTFSMHGDSPELHDGLTGTPGSFVQAMAGLGHALEAGWIVNVDVVINRRNISRLRWILEYYLDRGVREFDLLHITPFGLAWRNWPELHFDTGEHLPSLHHALDLARRDDVVIWTNRLRPEYLQGFEDMIQSPLKLHDEVRGRREMFDDWVRKGIQPLCRDERCGSCFLRDYCSHLENIIKGTPTGSTEAGEPLPLTSARDVEASLQSGVGPMTVVLNSETSEALLSRRDRLRAGKRRLCLVHEGRERLETAAEHNVPLKSFFERFGKGGVETRRIPGCLSGVKPDYSIEGAPTTERAEWNFLEEFTSFFIRRGYYIRSLNCESCSCRSDCRGLHINDVRLHGFQNIGADHG